MINHKRPKQSLWSFDDERDAFKIEAYGDCCLKNSELFDSYGKKCNSRFLLNYGFIEEDNDANEYEFKIAFTKSHQFYQKKVDMINQLKDYSTFFKISRDFESKKFFDFLSFIRFLMVDNDEDFKKVRVKHSN